MSKSIRSDGRVEVFLPRASLSDDPNFFVGVNGESFLLPRGKSSFVPPAVAEEIQRAQRAQNLLDERVDALLRQTAKD